MSLQKAMFYGAATCLVLSRLSGLALLGLVVFHLITGTTVDGLPFVTAFLGFTVLRAFFAFFLRKLGGIPAKFRKA